MSEPIDLKINIDARGASDELVKSLPHLLQENRIKVIREITEGIRRNQYHSGGFITRPPATTREQPCTNWQEVADARERQERKLMISRCSYHLDEHGTLIETTHIEPLVLSVPKDSWAERRARVNNEIWMHGDAPDYPHPESPRWLLPAVIVSVLVLLMSLYVLSCGATPWGACWK